MQYIITDCQKTQKRRVDIVLNETIRFWLYVGEAKRLSLEEGKTLSEEDYQHILHEVIGKRAIKRAMRLLERQERTECRLREKLLQSEYPKEAIEDAILYVKQYHYLDDERYARTFIQCHQEERGRNRLKMDLMRRGVPKDIIEQCIEEEFEADEKAQIRLLMEKKHFCNETADQKERMKMLQFLMRRGFSYSDIRSALR